MEGNEALEWEKIGGMSSKVDESVYANDPKTSSGTHLLSASALTLYDIDRKGLWSPLHSFDPSCADIVSIEAGLEAVDENTTVAVNCEVHAWRHTGAVVHAEAQVCGFRVGEQAGQ